MPDPDQVTSADWANIHNWLTLLWIYFFVVIGFAFTMLIAHAWIPSMLMTRQLPPIAGRGAHTPNLAGSGCSGVRRDSHGLGGDSDPASPQHDLGAPVNVTSAVHPAICMAGAIVVGGVGNGVDLPALYSRIQVWTR